MSASDSSGAAAAAAAVAAAAVSRVAHPILNLFARGHGADTPGAPETVDVLVNIPVRAGSGAAAPAGSAGATRVERIVSHGHASPAGFWYDQDEAEWVAVLEGEGVLEYDDGQPPVVLRRGDSVYLAPHQRHRVASTAAGADTIWLAVFFPAEAGRGGGPGAAGGGANA
jgi:cupin 2 domain-containing protein